jgi:hypothetical protein
MQPKYAFYATLLDAFAWYKRSEDEGAKQEFLDKVNRVQTPPTDPMLRGIAFEAAVVAWAGCPGNPDAVLQVHDKKCPGWILEEFTRDWKGSVRQIYVETILPTNYGEVKVYGYVDEILRDTAADIKTTSSYTFPKYLHNWQHPVYLEALQGSGIDRFKYRATDFREVYEEEYLYNPQDTERLIGECSHLIEFLEANRPAITDTKVFGQAGRDRVTQ